MSKAHQVLGDLKATSDIIIPDIKTGIAMQQNKLDRGLKKVVVLYQFDL